MSVTPWLQMNKDIRVYKPNRFYNLVNGLTLLALFFFGLTLPVLIELTGGVPVETRKLIGLGGFWFIGIILTLAPFGFKMEVGNDYVKTYFLGLSLGKTYASDVQVLFYGNLFQGGIGFGKGLRYRVQINGRSKSYSIGEKFWGKEAFAHAKRVLESQLPKKQN